MNNKVIRIILSFVLIATLMFIAPSTSYASKATGSVSASKSTVNVGDTVTVTLTFSASNIGAVSGSLTYNSDILKYKSDTGNVSVSGGSGTIMMVVNSANANSLSTSITFEAAKEGSADFRISGDVFSFEEESLGSVSPRTTIKVTKPTPPPPPPSQPSQPSTPPSQPSQPTTPAPAPEPEPEPPNPVEEALEVIVDGATLFMWTDLSTVKVPDNFKKEEVDYGSDKVAMAVSEDNGLVLAYLTDEEGENGNFFVYESDSNKFYPYFTFSTSNNYTILQIDSSAEIPEGYVEAELTLDEQVVQAWQQESGENPDFFLIYAMNSEGEKHFYLYDKSEETIQRFFDKTVEVEVLIEPEPQTLFQRLSNDKPLMGIVVVLTTLVLALSAFLGYIFFKPSKKSKISI